MAQFALICGIAALFTLLLGGTPLFAGLGIMFALLSRKQVMDKSAKIALIISSISLAIYTLVIAVSMAVLVKTGVFSSMMEKANSLDLSDPNAIAEFEQEMTNELYESLIGDDPSKTQYEGGEIV